MCPLRDFRRGMVFSIVTALATLGSFSAAQADGVVLTSFSSGIVGGKAGAFPLTSNYIPPDTQLAVGTQTLVHLTNGAAAFYNKSGAVLRPIVTLDQFWTDAGIANVNGAVEPRVIYDPSSKLYYASSLDAPRPGQNANNLLLAVSRTSNPLDGWQGYKIPVNFGNRDHFGDANALGFNAQGVFLSLSSFQSVNGAFIGSTTFAIAKSDLLAFPNSLKPIAAYEKSATLTGFSLQPVVDYSSGSIDASGRFVARYFDNSFAVSRFTGSLENHSAIYQATGQNVFATNYAPPPPEGAIQKGTNQTIDAGDNLLTSAVIQRGDNIYLVQGVSSPVGRAAIRLLVFRASDNVVLLDKLVSDPNRDLYFPSVAVNDTGDLVIGYSASGADAYASAYAVVGKLNASRSSVAFETPILLAAGVATYRVPSSGLNRWGEYSATWIDPTEPNRFWTAQEYAIAKDQWGTYISQISVHGDSGATNAPEPATIFLFALGGTCTLLTRRRKSPRRS